ncbi:MAG: hypothetical protein ACP5DZ_09075, partial [Bacteroidales bacterium]
SIIGRTESTARIQVTNENTGKTVDDGLLIQMHNKNASIYNQENGSLSLQNNGSLLVKLEQSDNLSITGGNLAMNKNQIRFKGSGDQNHRINYTNENGLDGLHIQGNKGVEIATTNQYGTARTVMTVKDVNVGIGIGNPENRLHVKRGSNLYPHDGTAEAGNYPHNYSEYTAYIENVGGSGAGLLIQAGSNQDYGYPLFVQSHNEDDILAVSSRGNVGIGTAYPQYELDVAGTGQFKKVVVEIANTGDYILSPDFNRDDFNIRMERIFQDEHLPYLLPGATMENEGMPISETINGLIKNVEELYLYLDDAKKEIKQLAEEITELKKENESLKSYKNH